MYPPPYYQYTQAKKVASNTQFNFSKKIWAKFYPRKMTLTQK
jgi:hypothetical protein